MFSEIYHIDDIKGDGSQDLFNSNQNVPPSGCFQMNKKKLIRLFNINTTTMLDDDNTASNHKRLNLYFSIFVVSLTYVSSAQSFVWTSPTLPYLLSPDSFLPVTPEQGSLIASLLVFGGMLGALVMRPLADYLGRRWTVMICSIGFLTSWALIFMAKELWVIYMSRIISGVASGVVFSMIPIYTAELSEDSLRGALNSLVSFSCSCGYVFVYAIGPYVSYHRLSLLCTLCPLICFLLTPLIAESPHFLVAQGRHARAVKTVQWLRGHKSQPAAEREVDAIKEYISQRARDKKSIADLFSTVGNLRALYISGVLLALQQLCGITVILLYTEPIFLLTGSSISASLSALLIGSTMLVSAFVVPPIIKRYGFIKPMVVSGIGCSLFVGLLGLFFFLKSLQVNTSHLNWLPITSLFLYTISYTLGLGTVPWAVVGEIFPANTKSLAAGILISFNFLLGFLTTVLFDHMNTWFGVWWSFWMYAAFSLSAAPFTYYLMPDTQGLSLDQIQHLFNLPRNTRWTRQSKKDLDISCL